MHGYYVYILQSLLDSSYYIGFSTAVDRRLEEHNQGKSRYTKGKTPWKVVYTEGYESKMEALKREKFLKAQKNRKFYERLITGEV
ncbi:MAG: GIY-YIG nuclease family protein [Bacteroidetes bacterium]|nr:MAG: GIY-YIG nuclease family protein [Bacteroidota bacterium]